MKKFALITTLLLFSYFDSFGQLYEKIYAESGIEVQEKINQNKNSGIEILTGIKTHHIVGLTGIGLNQRNVLNDLLTNSTNVVSFILNEDATSLIMESKATFTKEDLNLLITPLSGMITGYSANYYTNEQ